MGLFDHSRKTPIFTKGTRIQFPEFLFQYTSKDENGNIFFDCWIDGQPKSMPKDLLSDVFDQVDITFDSPGITEQGRMTAILEGLTLIVKNGGCTFEKDGETWTELPTFEILNL